MKGYNKRAIPENQTLYLSACAFLGKLSVELVFGVMSVMLILKLATVPEK
jgi:hypothetical protein